MPIKIAVFDHESSGKHKPMGEFHTTVNGLKNAATRNEIIKLKHKGKDVGTIQVVTASVDGVEALTKQMASTTVSSRPAPTVSTTYVPAASTPSTFVPGASAAPAAGGANFVDYIAGGCELNVTVAIDFTGSNGGESTELRYIIWYHSIL